MAATASEAIMIELQVIYFITSFTSRFYKWILQVDFTSSFYK